MKTTQSTPPWTWNNFAWKIFLATLIAIGVTLLVVALWQFGRVFLLVFAAILFAVFLRGLTDDLSRATGLRSNASLAIVICGLAGLAAGLGFFTAPRIAAQFGELREALPNALARLREWAAGSPIFGDAIAEAQQALSPGSAFLQSLVPKMFTTTLSALVSSLFIFVVGIYLAVRPGAYVGGLLKLLPMDYRDRAAEVLSAIGYTLQRWLVGQVVVMVIVGTATATGLAIAGIPLALTLGIIAGLFDFIPNFGPFLAAIPGMLIAFHSGPEHAVYAAFVYIAVQQLEGYLVSPLVFKRMVRLEPALTISAQLAFGLTMGFLGILLATPIVAASTVAVKMLYVEDMLGDETDVEQETNGSEKEDQDRRKDQTYQI